MINLFKTKSLESKKTAYLKVLFQAYNLTIKRITRSAVIAEI